MWIQNEGPDYYFEDIIATIPEFNRREPLFISGNFIHQLCPIHGPPRRTGDTGGVVAGTVIQFEVLFPVQCVVCGAWV